LCTTAVLFGWLAILLWMTYLPAQADDVVRPEGSFAQTVATVQRAAGDLPRLDERVRGTDQAVLPSVVAIENPVGIAELVSVQSCLRKKSTDTNTLVADPDLETMMWSLSLCGGQPLSPADFRFPVAGTAH